MFKRIAVVHDWLPVYAGAERVLEQILKVFPTADVYSLIDLIPNEERGFLQGKTVHTSFLQKWGWVRRNYRKFLPLMPFAIEQFDLSAYDLVISSSYAVAKGVITSPAQLHVCYCHSPMRYAWDLQHQYLRESGLEKGFGSMAARLVLHYLRMWDSQTPNRVDRFIANSEFVKERIHKTYRRDALVINPPVDVENFKSRDKKGDYYVTASRLVPYKMVTHIIEAFNRMPERELRVIGDGPLFAKCQRLAGPNVKIMGHQPFEVLREQLQGARAFVFAALEDFGIVPVEAQACGTPVIAYGMGGVRESVIPGVTGHFFREQTPEAIVQAVEVFESRRNGYSSRSIRSNAERFSVGRFRNSLLKEVEAAWVAKFGDLEQAVAVADESTSNDEAPVAA